MGILSLVLNRASGAGDGAAAGERLAERFRAGGWEVRLTLAGSGDELEVAVRRDIEAGVAVVVAGGGDGTVSAVAALLAGRDVSLGIIPLGTLNHLARDLGIPLDADAAAAVVLAGHTESIDLGEVNGRTFVNNASLGLYAQIVRLRQRHPARGLRKWIIAAWVTIKVLARHRSMALRLDVDGEVVLRRTPIVFVGNNEYRAAGLAAGSRDSLSDGALAVYVVKAGGRRHPLRLVRLAWHLVRGVALDGDHLELFRVGAATVESKRERLHMALDGEVLLFESPLEFRIRPRALRVYVPG